MDCYYYIVYGQHSSQDVFLKTLDQLQNNFSDQFKYQIHLKKKNNQNNLNKNSNFITNKTLSLEHTVSHSAMNINNIPSNCFDGHSNYLIIFLYKHTQLNL